jgi:hypothetical protein
VALKKHVAIKKNIFCTKNKGQLPKQLAFIKTVLQKHYFQKNGD